MGQSPNAATAETAWPLTGWENLEQTETMQTKLMHLKAMAEALDIHPETLRQLAATGKVPAMRLTERGHWLFDSDAVLAELRRKAEGTTPLPPS